MKYAAVNQAGLFHTAFLFETKAQLAYAVASVAVKYPDSFFVFNRQALTKLQLSSKRIYFYLETLQDLAQRRNLKVLIGNPYEYAANHDVAVTFAPVPSFNKFTDVAELHPYPWLRKPHALSVQSFSAWRNKLGSSV